MESFNIWELTKFPAPAVAAPAIAPIAACLRTSAQFTSPVEYCSMAMVDPPPIKAPLDAAARRANPVPAPMPVAVNPIPRAMARTPTPNLQDKMRCLWVAHQCLTGWVRPASWSSVTGWVPRRSVRVSWRSRRDCWPIALRRAEFLGRGSGRWWWRGRRGVLPTRDGHQRPECSRRV